MEHSITLYLHPGPQSEQLSCLLRSIGDCIAGCAYDRALDYFELALERVLGTLYTEQAGLQRAALRVARAELLALLGRWDQALEDVERILYGPSPVKDSSLLLRAWLIRARVNSYYGDYTEARASLQRAQPLAEKSGSRLLQARVALESGIALHGLGESGSSREVLHQVEELLCVLPHASVEPTASEVLASSFLQRGLQAFQEHQLGPAVEAYQWALAICDSLGQQDLGTGSIAEAETLHYFGILKSVQGSPGEALELHRRALELYHKFHLPLGMAKTYGAMGQCCLDASHLEEALVFIQMAERMSRRLGAQAEVAPIYSKLGRCYTQLGRYTEGVMFHRKDVEMCRRFGNYRGLAFATFNLGLAHRAKGDMEDALLALQESLARFAEMGDRPHTAHVRLELARTYLDRGRLSDARSEISIASELLGDAAESVNAGLVLLLSGILQRLAQDYPQSERSLEEARRIFTAVGRDSGLAECHGELAVFYLETGRTELASEHLRTALRLARRLEMHGLVRDCVAQLARLDELALVRTLVDCVIQDRQSLGAPGGPCGPSAIADFAAIPEN